MTEAIPCGQLPGGACRLCGEVSLAARRLCPRCFGPLEPRLLSGRGTVHSFTVVHSAPLGWRSGAPYVLAWVRLDEGPMLTTQITADRPTEVQIGDRVELVVPSEGAGPLPFAFRRVALPRPDRLANSRDER